MIQLPDDLVWVRAEDDRLTPFDAGRLAKSIQGDSLLAESIAAAVELYARECLPRAVISADEIIAIVQSVLTMLGCEPAAQAYALRRCSAQIRLDELAGFELEFFRQLDTALGRAADEEMAHMELRGLRGCVMRLNGAQRWGQRCRVMAEEIIDFARTRAAQIRPPQSAALRLDVFE